MKEGDDLSITCLPSTATVGLEWEIPITASITGAAVEYDEPLRHTVTIRNADINHEGHYICRVAGDVLGENSSATAFVKVRGSKKFMNYSKRRNLILTFLSVECLEDFTGGLFWEVAFEGDTIAKPCTAIDNSFRYVKSPLPTLSQGIDNDVGYFILQNVQNTFTY